MRPGRLVAVLGYSSRHGRELHPVCAARLAHAAGEARPTDAVLLSGWSRRRARASEAELMARAWRGSAASLHLDSAASTTYGNAVAVARSARSLGPEEIVLVTSGWHGRRAATLVRAALRDSTPTVIVAATDERGSLARRCRELLCWTVVPVQVALTRVRLGWWTWLGTRSPSP